MYPYAVFLGMGWYEIFLTVGILAVFFLADRLAIKSGFSVNLQRVLIVAFVAAIAVGFGGAVLFQAFYDFMETGVFKIDSTTGMTFYGGLLLGVPAFIAVWLLGGKWFCKNEGGNEAAQRFEQMANIAGCLIPLAHGFGRIGCFFAGCCHGNVTDAWYGVKMWTEKGWQTVVPVQLFEAVFLFVLAAVLLWLFFFRQKEGREGLQRLPLLGAYGVLYGIWRFFIEFARGDNRGETIVSFLSPSQLVALLLIVAGATYICIRFFRKEKEKIKENN